MARGRKKAEEVLEDQTVVNTDTTEEEINMSDVKNEQVELEGTEVEVEAAPVEVAEKVALLSDATGLEISRSAFIRQEFLKDRPRGDIAKQLGVAYGIVYSATANMANAVHQGTDDGGTSRGVIMDHPVTGEKIARAEYCREQVAAGRSRGELAKELGIAYATVYAATKELTPAGGATFGGTRVHVEVDGESKPRSEYIRELFEEGKTRREIANELGCDYAVVWAATKALVEKAKEEEVVAETVSEQE